MTEPRRSPRRKAPRALVRDSHRPYDAPVSEVPSDKTTGKAPAVFAHEGATELLRSLLGTVPAFITCLGEDYRIRYINRAEEEGPILGQSVFDFIAPEDHARARACFESVLRTGERGRYESRAGCDGALAYYENHVSPLRHADGTTGLCIVGLDISERREREASLRLQSEKLELAAEATGLGLWDWDLHSGEVYWDARMREMVGCEKGMPLEQFAREFVHPDHREKVLQEGKDVLERGWFRGNVYRIVRPDGESRWHMSSGRVHYDERGQAVRMIGSVIDISEQRDMEERLVHAQKMQAMGTLTAGVTNSFNQMLMVLMPALDELHSLVPKSEREILVDAQETTRRAAMMIRQLMTYAGHRMPLRRQECSLSAVVTESLQRLRALCDPKIRVRFHEAPDPHLSVDPAEIEQVLSSILENACDALSTGTVPSPRIDIYIEERTHPPSVPEGRAATSRFACLRVRDNGPGMTESVREQIFEPFFTTKAGADAGMSLATAYRIAADHGGWIDCHSRPGSGSEFRIWLPLSAHALHMQGTESMQDDTTVTAAGTCTLPAAPHPKD